MQAGLRRNDDKGVVMAARHAQHTVILHGPIPTGVLCINNNNNERLASLPDYQDGPLPGFCAMRSSAVGPRAGLAGFETHGECQVFIGQLQAQGDV